MKGKAFALAGAAGAFIVSGTATAAYLGTGGDVNLGLTAELVNPDEQFFLNPITMMSSSWTDLGYDAGALDTYRVYANFSDNSGLITAVGDADGLWQLNSTNNAFFNSAASGNFAPNPFAAASVPDALWDTFVTIGETVAGVGGAVTAGAPGFDDETDPPDDPMGVPTGGQIFGIETNSTLTNTGWFVDGFPPEGNTVNNRVLVMQITVAEGVLAEGLNWRVSGLNVQGDADSSFDIISSWVIPAPGAMALLGIAGLVSGRRRRR